MMGELAADRHMVRPFYHMGIEREQSLIQIRNRVDRPATHATMWLRTTGLAQTQRKGGISMACIGIVVYYRLLSHKILC